jgi:hypothetical protein
MEYTMQTFSAIFGALLAVAILASAGCSVPEDQQAIAAITEFGGRIKTDSHSRVVEVDLSRTKANDGVVAMIRALPFVKSLNCSQTLVTGASLDQLAELHELETLFLVGSELNDAGMAHLAPLTSLNTLHVGSTKITDAGLPAVRGLSQLRTFTASSTDISDAGMVNFRNLKDLATLQLRRTKVTQAGVQELRRFLPNTQIDR